MFNLKCLLPDTSVGHFVFFLRLIAACFEAEKIKYFLRRLSVSFFLSTDVSRNFQVCRNTFSFCLPPLSLSLRLRLSSVSMSVNFRECSLIVSALVQIFLMMIFYMNGIKQLDQFLQLDNRISFH